MTETSKKINSREDAVRFFDYLIKVENANFHPDDDFCNYVSLGTNEKSFSPEKCALLNQRMDECFTVLGDKIYDVAQACVNKHYPLLKQKQSGDSVNGKPKLMFANGGPMDAGGFGSQRSFTIAELKAYLEKEFPYSLGFKLYPYKPNARTLEPDLSNYEGLTDAEIKDKLFFGSIGKWHSVNIEMQQGQENTYFYFALETESNKESYIGSFGFKDRGDVPLWYARKFINFLMDAYDMPKEEITKLSERMATVSELKELADHHQPIGRPFPNRLRYSGYETGGTVNPSIQQMVESYIPPINYHNRKNEPFRFTVECGFIYSSLELQSLTENFKSYGNGMGYTSLVYSVDQAAGRQKTNTLTFKVRKYNFTDIN